MSCQDSRSALMAACQELLIASYNPLRFSVMHAVEKNQSVEGNTQYRWTCGDV